MIEAKAPGRICFFGDHQDYLTLPVIAGTIDKFVRIKGDPNGKEYLLLKLINFDSEILINLNESMENLKKEQVINRISEFKKFTKHTA